MSGDKVHHIDSLAELDALFASHTYVAVDFFADWCPPCKQIAPIYAQISKDNSVDSQLAFAKINVDHAREAAARYNISAMPTFMFFKEGNHVKVNGQNMIQGADRASIQAAVTKLKGLADKRVAEAN